MTTKKIQRIIGKEIYINQKTGEVEEFDVINFIDSDLNFQKIWLGHLLTALKLIGNKKIEVLSYLLKQKDYKNTVISSQRKIATELKISTKVVNETIKSLISVDAISMVQQGVYQLNPDIIFKGKHSQRMKILLDYNQTKKEDSFLGSPERESNEKM